MKAAVTDDVIIAVLKGGDPAVLNPPGVELCVTLSTLSEVYRVAEETAGRETARRAVSELAFLLKILPEPTGERLMSAFNSDMGLPDSVLAASAAAAGIGMVVTLRPEAFSDSKLKAVSPGNLLGRGL